MICRLLLRRAALNLGLLAMLSIAVFAGVHALPGDPVVARLGPTASAEQIDAARSALGLDQPVLVRYGEWAYGLAQGNHAGRTVVAARAGQTSNDGKHLPMQRAVEVGVFQRPGGSSRVTHRLWKTNPITHAQQATCSNHPYRRSSQHRR